MIVCDQASRDWLLRLVRNGREREQALEALYALLVKAARFTLAQRRGLLPFPRETLEDLAVEPASEALVRSSRISTTSVMGVVSRPGPMTPTSSAITDPDAQIVKRYTAGLMAPAIASLDLAHKTDDLRALVAFIKSKPIRSKSPPHEGRDR